MQKIKTKVTAKSYVRKRSGRFTVKLPKNCVWFDVVNAGTEIMMGDYTLKPGERFYTKTSLMIRTGIVFSYKKGAAFVLTTEIQQV